ncbi:MAG: hypothetical protein HFJ48_07265 [Clostridia bacterium]|nr:hypothetical protein [Clostridia bacterium]
MLKEEFINLIKGAKVDKYGNLYIDGKYENRVYFATITTICDDLIEEHCSEEKNGFELYDRHFWNDDTLECKIANVGKLKSRWED